MKHLATNNTSETGVEGSENTMTARGDPNTICYGSESSTEAKFETCKCNNNEGDCDFGGYNREIKVDCACLKENRQNDGNVCLKSGKKSQKKRGTKKNKSPFRESKKEKDSKEMCQDFNRNEEEIKSSEHNLSTVGGDGEEKSQERSQCRQHELNPSSNEINRPDVTTSCDLTSNSVIKSKSESSDEESNQNRKDCPRRTRTSSCSVFQSTCSEGSYSRRKHHKHHKHKKRNNSPPARTEDDPPICPKVNPIFLWVRQEDTKIVEVLCEDYDHRNRLRLTRTHLGWRAIPKTKTFAEAIIPRASPKEEKKGCNKPKHGKRLKKRKKSKKKKEQKTTTDNPSQIKECSVALSRDDLANYKCKALMSSDQETPPESKSYLAEPQNSQSPIHQSRPSSPESIIDTNKSLNNFRKLTKSNSCDFSSLRETFKSFPRSISLDLKLTRNNIDFKVQSDEVIKPENKINNSIKSEGEKAVEEQVPNMPSVTETETETEAETEFGKNQRNHSESDVVDMTKHDLDFNDTDCDELGQLLKDIPDLEFVEEEELEEIDEEEDWLKPTDLTVQKPAAKDEPFNSIKLPANITPVVTVTSSVKPPEPLTAPLPEVTITPITKPKPAHQQKPQNNFLESLLSSSRSVKPEHCEMFQKKQGKPFPPCERKAVKHFQDDVELKVKNKKLKVEDITLKSLLSRNQTRTMKPVEEFANSRLQELLTEKVSSDPITQLKEVLSNPLLSVPDPLLVPRARLPALVASPASEIPRLLSMHLEKPIEETPCPPMTDSDILEVSLSNLQSLLSCSPEKLNSANTQDLAKYQKSLETFLEWQRYQSELMESQIKNSKSMLSGFPGDISDVAAATAFSQMFWLPYLNQFDFNCNANRDFMNSMLMNDYQANCSNLSAPPQINTNQVSQPSPFLTPTSPMEFESHLKTLAMWQEALMMQQNSQFSRACTKVSNHQDVRRSAKFSNFPGMKKTSPESVPKASISSRVDNHLDFDVYHAYQNEYYKRQNRQSNFHQSQNQFKKMQQNYGNYQTELLKQCKVNEKKKSGPVPGGISVKPLANLIDRNVAAESKNSWEEEALKRNADFTSQVASKLLQFNTQIQKTKSRREEKPFQEEKKPVEIKPVSTETPKLKVKNLVDPNMSPPKLLKQIAPEHLPIVMDDKGPVQDDGQPNLWHPLFGSNQIKLQPYNSPWRWTTVTVNGE